MERTITYKITDSGQNIRIHSFLRKHGYSMQNLTLLQNARKHFKMEERLYMQTTLQAGDILTVPHSGRKFLSQIRRQSADRYCCSTKDEDIIANNKAAGMPIYPSLNNYRNSLAKCADVVL